jgi:hypothetical protein
MRHLAAWLMVGMLSVSARADWSIGAGYHDPPDATAGLNFMYLWTNWAVQFGIGYVGSSENWNSKNNAYAVGGDINFQYLFLSGLFRPYLVGGFGSGVALDKYKTISAGATISNPFGGGGFYLMGSDLYVYLGFLILNEGEFQAGFGIPF